MATTYRVHVDDGGADAVARFEDQCMQLLEADIRPADVSFDDTGASGLFDAPFSFAPRARARLASVLPARSARLWRHAAHHRRSDRLAALYALLHARRSGPVDALDARVRRVGALASAVRRDAHKMKAFLRFVEMPSSDDVRAFGAWHRTEHRVLPLVAKFFADRFSDMRFSIWTPDLSMHFTPDEGHRFDVGAPRRRAPEGDELEALWCTYYRATFNPARIRLQAMKSEMPKKHWATMVETTQIASMLAEAPRRVAAMAKAMRILPSASARLPAKASLPQLRALLPHCRDCELHDAATQVVPGEGPANAHVVLVGEAPGDAEDRAGRPFVGPAGQLLRRCCAEAKLPWDGLYRTNAVKHFRFRGKRRLHDKPRAGEIRACAGWLRAELDALEAPEVIVCLGRTALTSLMGAHAPKKHKRGDVLSSPWAPRVIYTWHPAAILRAGEDEREGRRQELVRHLARFGRVAGVRTSETA